MGQEELTWNLTNQKVISSRYNILGTKLENQILTDSHEAFRKLSLHKIRQLR
jgi:hypothetical protein